MVTRKSVRAWLEGRFFLRIHMTLILAGTFLAGLVATRVLMTLGVNTLAVRYAIAVCLAYAVFLALVKLWLLYVGSDGDASLDPEDAIELGADGARVVGLHSGSRGSGGGGSSWDLDFGDDLGGLIFMIVLIVSVIFLGGIAIYYIYMAPAVLGEAFFEVVLAASIARRAKSAEGAGWLRAVWRATVWPFLGVLALSILLGWLAQRHCPEALELRDAVNCGSVM